MVNCCGTGGHEEVFDAAMAGRMADRYRAHGPGRSARRVVDLATQLGVRDATILEIGGGIGAVHIELLRRGAQRAVNLELSSAYEPAARQLLNDHGFTGRVERRVLDIATRPSDVEPADIVVLHRVVCCYPDYRSLLGAAADHARRGLVFSHPPRQPLWQASIATENVVNRLKGNEFRAFVHSPRAMRQVVVEQGLRPFATRHGFIWTVVAARRDAR